MSRLDYLLVDLDRVRDAQLIEHAIDVGREKWNNDNLSSFTWVTFAELSQAGAIIDLDLQLPTWHELRSPTWYTNHCDRINKAVWRGQITDAEATRDLAVMHAAAMRLAWPEGWTTEGRIRTL